MRLSGHFTSGEFACRHCGKLPDQPFGSYNDWWNTSTNKERIRLDALTASMELNATQHKVSPDLLIKLERLREKAGQAVHVSSGYRCPVHNKAIGGAKNSQHLKGTAADITVKNLTPAQVKALAEPIFGYKSGIGLYSGFCHLDVRQWHARW